MQKILKLIKKHFSEVKINFITNSLDNSFCLTIYNSQFALFPLFSHMIVNPEAHSFHFKRTVIDILFHNSKTVL